MRSGDEIHAILQADVDHTREHYRVKVAEFKAVIADIPSGIPGSDASLFVKQASQNQADAIQAFCDAVRRYDAFMLHGEVPEDLVN